MQSNLGLRQFIKYCRALDKYFSSAGAMKFGPLTEAQVKEIQTIVGNYELKG